MQTLILNDIPSIKESIIPYALKITRDFKGRAEIIHLIDPRQKHAKTTPYADSQTISPKVEDRKELNNKEEFLVHEQLDRLLSSEVSRLNFPLKVNTETLEGSLHELNKIAEYRGSNVIIVNSRQSHFNTTYIDEIIEIAGRSGSMVLVTNHKLQYKYPWHIIFWSNSDKDIKTAIDTKEFLNKYLENSKSNGSVRKEYYLDPVIEVDERDQNIELDFNTHSIDTIAIDEEINDALKRKYDLVVMSNSRLTSTPKSKKFKLLKKAIETDVFPVLIVPQ